MENPEPGSTCKGLHLFSVDVKHSSIGLGGSNDKVHITSHYLTRSTLA